MLLSPNSYKDLDLLALELYLLASYIHIDNSNKEIRIISFKDNTKPKNNLLPKE